jgi:hypothetical protein
MIHININALDLPTFSAKNCRAFGTTRLDPFDTQVISSAFDAFNLGLHVGDNNAQVMANRQKLQRLLPEKTDIQWMDQVHGSTVLSVDTVEHFSPQVDALITRKPRLALAVMTADCLPIVLSSTLGDEIAVIHGGWRSLAGNIIAHTIEKMQTPPHLLEAYLGACIQQAAFEVRSDVYQAFERLSPDCLTAFLPVEQEISTSIGTAQHFLASLPQIASLLLQQQGVNHIVNNGGCTFQEPERYYSFRRDEKTGRMATIAWLKAIS